MKMFVKEILFFLISSPLFVDAIIGGEYVTNPHEYPWMVNIKSFELETIKSSKKFPKPLKIDFSSSGSCGGAIISENMILTAAHCIKHGWSEYSRNREFKKTAILVRIGHSSLNHSITVRVKSKLIYPNYFDDIHTKRVFDIALIELAEVQ
jgi:secreted trypsin-like serine protease